MRTTQAGKGYLRLNKLEFLSITTSQDLKNILLPLPSLKHLHIKTLLDVNLERLLAFSNDKNITLDFDVLILNTSSDNYVEILKLWEKVKKKFKLSNFYEGYDFREFNYPIYYSVSHTYTKNNWLAENGYYIKEDCSNQNS